MWKRCEKEGAEYTVEKQTYLYDAFISYRHLPLDKMVAVRLQQLLENLKTVEVTEGKKTKRQIRVFRDQSELPTSGDLGGDIRLSLIHI